MSEPIRRRIVDILSSGEHQTYELEGVIILEFGVGRSAVQHHLRVLREHEWVIVRAEWSEHYYRLAPSTIPRLESEVRSLRRKRNRRIGWMDGLPERSATKRQIARGQRLQSLRGRRGHGRDPDDPWFHPEQWMRG